MAEPWYVQLWLAAQAGRVDEVRRLLGCDPFLSGKHRGLAGELAIYRALHVSVCNDHVASTVVMLTASRALENRGVSLLHTAARNGNAGTLRLLLTRGAPAGQYLEGRSCIGLAVEHGDLNAAKVLVEYGADVNSTDDPLCIAAQAGHVDMARFLLESRAVLDTACAHGCSPLVHAALKQHWDMVAFLLQRGADVDTVDSYSGSTSLAVAASYGHCETAKLLLHCRAAVDGADSRSVPLAAAVENEHVAMALLLLHHGAAVDKETGSSRLTPLMIAAFGGQVESARVLLEHKASVVRVGTYGLAPLARACTNGHVELAKVLLAYKAPVNLDDHVPLIYACDRGHLELAKVLLDHKAAIDQTDRSQRTPLICAVRANCVSVVRLLLERGVDIERCPGTEGPPLAQAVQYGHTDLAEFLVASKASIECRGRSGATLLQLAQRTNRWLVRRVRQWYK
jgi:ankyrin repeat protein